jgi:hypothetical protein
MALRKGGDGGVQSRRSSPRNRAIAKRIGAGCDSEARLESRAQNLGEGADSPGDGANLADRRH